MNRILLSISMLLSTAVCALGIQNTITKTNNTGFIAHDFHLGLKENVVITTASSSVFTSWQVQHVPNIQNVNTLINYSGGGTVAPGESASFYYTHALPSTSVTRLKWTAENGNELPSISPGNSQSGYPGKLTPEWLYNLDNEMHGDYVAEYNAQTGQSLSGAVTISGIDYALSPTPIPPEQLEYFVLGGLLNFTPLSGPVVIPLGGDVELPPIVRDPQNDYIILRYRTTFTGDVHASTNEVFHASQTEPVPGACEPEIVGGAIYTDCDAPLTSGEDGVEVTVSGPSGIFSAITTGPSGTWHIPGVPCGEYTVAPDQVFRKYCHVDIGGDCPPELCETPARIIVDADHRAENLSIQFLGQPACITNDLNYDEVCSIVFDTDLFVQCVYDGDCVGPDGQDLQCPADCNCDGLATIVFDANCFVHDVYVKDVCGECPDGGSAHASRRSKGRQSARGFTIGGAVYDDETNPLLSGIEGVSVRVFGAGRKTAAIATTAGSSGIWRVDDLPAGIYTVVFARRDGRAATGRDMLRILVNEEHEAANLSMRLLRSPDPSRRSTDGAR